MVFTFLYLGLQWAVLRKYGPKICGEMKKFMQLMTLVEVLLLVAAITITVDSYFSLTKSITFKLMHALIYVLSRTSDVLAYLFFFKFKRVETQMQMRHLTPEEITTKM